MFIDMFHIQIQLMQGLDQWNEYVCMYICIYEYPVEKDSSTEWKEGVNG